MLEVSPRSVFIRGFIGALHILTSLDYSENTDAFSHELSLPYFIALENLSNQSNICMETRFPRGLHTRNSAIIEQVSYNIMVLYSIVLDPSVYGAVNLLHFPLTYTTWGFQAVTFQHVHCL